MSRRKYLLSLPERIIRALAAAVGGVLYELSQVILPAWVRRSQLYRSIVARLLRITVEWIGDVQGIFPQEELGSQDLVVRKAAGNVLEVAGLFAIGWSPLWILAAASDLTGGAKTYLASLVSELKTAGVLAEDTDISTVDELLLALEGTTGQMADLVDVPPLNVEDLRASWVAMKQNVHLLPKPRRLAALFNQLIRTANQGHLPLETASMVLAISAMRAGVKLGNVYLFEYYRQSLEAIHHEGWASYTYRALRPYFAAAGSHFDARRETKTDTLLEWIRRSYRRKPTGN